MNARRDKEIRHQHAPLSQITQAQHPAANRQPVDRRPHEQKNHIHQKPSASGPDSLIRRSLRHDPSTSSGKVPGGALTALLQRLRHKPYLRVGGEADQCVTVHPASQGHPAKAKVVRAGGHQVSQLAFGRYRAGYGSHRINQVPTTFPQRLPGLIDGHRGGRRYQGANYGPKRTVPNRMAEECGVWPLLGGR